MKKPESISDWVGIAVALAGCIAAVIFFGWILSEGP
jgi:hypothetical protein